MLFWQGGGGVNLEFLAIDKNTGQHVLVNDLAGTYVPTTAGAAVGSPITARNVYTGPVRPWVKFSVFPLPARWDNVQQQVGPGPINVKVGAGNGDVGNAAGNVRPWGDLGVGAVVADLGTGSVGMLLDGTNVTASLSITDIPSTTDKLVLYKPNPIFESGSTHTAGLIYAGTTNYWTFIVMPYTNVASSDSLPLSAADQTARGFQAKVVQGAAARAGGNTVAAAEAQLAGNPANVAIPGPNPDGSYIVPGIINWSDRRNTGGSGADVGNFQPAFGGPADDPIPGIPGTGAARDNIAAEIFAYLDLPAGYQKFGVNGDDGWKVQIGTPGQTTGTTLFTVDRGAGAADFPFAFITPQAGLYPIRLVWYEGGGDGNLEFFTYGADGEKIPINGTHPNAVKAYYRASGGGPGPAIAIAAQAGGNVQITYTGTLQATDTLSPPNWQNVASATSPFTVAASAAQRYYRTTSP